MEVLARIKESRSGASVYSSFALADMVKGEMVAQTEI
jgi:hypothetical protein